MTNTKRRKASRLSAVLAIAVLVSAAFSLASCGGDDVQPIDDLAVIPVRVAQPVLRRAEPAMNLTGALGAKEEIPLGFKIGGVVARVAADAGDRVRAGQLLAALSMTEIEAQVAPAREGRDKARRDLARVEALYADSVATLSQLQDARTGLEVAEAQLRAAEFNKEYAEVRAPADGVVLRRNLEAGQLVGPNMPVFFLRVERSGLVLRVGAADREAVKLSEGMRGWVRFDTFPADSFAGRVERVGVAASPMTGTYEVEIAVDPGQRRLASGLIGRAQIIPMADRALPVIPTESLLEVDGRTATIFVLSDDGALALRRRVLVAWLDGGVAALVGGVDTTTRVITAGASRLSDSTRVRVVLVTETPQ